MFYNVSKIVMCDRRDIFVSFLEDNLHFAWQAQHFGELRRHFAWQAQRLRRVVLHVFANYIVIVRAA